jgi:hypothetical protein
VEVRGRIERFLAAYNAGDQEQLLRFFPARAVSRPSVLLPGEERFFTWYAVGHFQNGKPIQEFVAYKREDLLPYFAQRHAQHEHLTLRTIEVGGPSWHGGGDFAIELDRQADDLPARKVIGKGAIDCQEGTIFVWAMGDDSRP